MKRLFIYGDSNTYGFDPFDFYVGRYPEDSIWPNIVQSKLKDTWEVTADGLNGREIPRSDGEFRRLEMRMRGACPPDLFAIMLGSNDYLVMGQPDADAVGGRMKIALTRISENIEAEKILLMAPPAMKILDAYGFGGGMFMGTDTSDGSLSEAYRKVADEIGCLFLDTLPWDVPVTADGVHFSEEGHAVFAERMTEYLNGIDISE